MTKWEGGGGWSHQTMQCLRSLSECQVDADSHQRKDDPHSGQDDENPGQARGHTHVHLTGNTIQRNPSCTGQQFIMTPIF